MKVILRENIENLGKKGDIVNVAPGYARNYLLPKKFAYALTATNKKMIEMEQKALRKGLEKEMKSIQALIERLNQVRLSFSRKTADKETLFGSVSVTDIKDSLDQQGFEIEKRRILLAEPIKAVGVYTIPLKVFHEERAEIQVEVIPEEAPAEAVPAEEAPPAPAPEPESEPEGEAAPQPEAAGPEAPEKSDAGDEEADSEPAQEEPVAE
jgi:large subunit ribosomal protein L9